MNSVLASFLFLWVISAAISGQYDPDAVRQARQLRTYYAKVGEAGVLEASAGSSSLSWTRLGYGEDAQPEATFVLPYTWQGGCTRVSDGGRRFILAGRDPQSPAGGRLLQIECQISPQDGIAQIENTVDLGASVDPIDVAYNQAEDRIYILDFAGKRVLSASWVESQPLPSAFVTAADATTLPLLTGAEGLEMRVLSDQPGIIVLGHKELGTLGRSRLYLDQQSQWTAEPAGPETGVAHYAMKAKQLANSRGPLYFFGGSGQCLIVDEETRATVPLVLPGSATDFVPVSIPGGEQVLIPGARYRIMWPDMSDGGTFRPLVRYGHPVAGGIVKCLSGRANPVNAYVGASSFGVATSLGVTPRPTGQFTESVTVSLFVAARDEDGTDPILEIGSAAVLLPDNVLGPWSYNLTDDCAARGIGQLQPIPSDPRLAGAVILWQWVVSGGGGTWVSYSDVFGTTIFGSAPRLATKQTEEIRSARIGSGLKASVVERALDWVTRGNKALPGEKADLSQALIQRMVEAAKSKTSPVKR